MKKPGLVWLVLVLLLVGAGTGMWYNSYDTASTATVDAHVISIVQGVVSNNNFIYPEKLSFTTNYTLTTNDVLVFCNGTNQVITCMDNTNAATPAGKFWMIYCINATGSVIVTNANGVETIKGSLSQTVTNGQTLSIVSDGSNYR